MSHLFLVKAGPGRDFPEPLPTLSNIHIHPLKVLTSLLDKVDTMWMGRNLYYIDNHYIIIIYYYIIMLLIMVD